MKVLQNHPKRVVVLSLEDYQKLSISLLNKLYRDGWEVTEVDYEQKYVVMINGVD
jgi:hypothetical protein